MMENQNSMDYAKALLADNRRYIRLAVGVGLVSMAAGAVVFYFWPQTIGYIMQIFQEKFGVERQLEWQLVLDIFKNNLISAGFALFGGILLGLAPLLVVVFNFFAIGIIAGFFFTGVPAGLASKILLFAAALLPHGIIELPVILFSCALGLRLGWRWMARESKGQRGQVLKADLLLALKMAPLLAALLFIAAIIEVYGTGNLLEWITPRIFG